MLEVLLAWLQKRPLPRGAGGPRRSKKTYLRSLAVSVLYVGDPRPGCTGPAQPHALPLIIAAQSCPLYTTQHSGLNVTSGLEPLSWALPKGQLVPPALWLWATAGV